jgi:lipopolysaccharide/colanic/teichoic acid biosynthesis glycosyltransferase
MRSLPARCLPALGGSVRLSRMSAKQVTDIRVKRGLVVKRLLDLAISTVFVLGLSPVMLAIGLAIKLDDGGPILFVQERAGRGKRPFRCYKFRSMVVSARERGLGGLVASDDDRLTRVGRFLRVWTLDEIPQLFNVLKGDMSIVGPRPWVIRQVEQIPTWASRRFDLKPGLAGWAWIHGRNLVPWDDRLRMDLWYIENWSLRLDSYILFRAFIQLFRRRGVYGPGGVSTDPEQ